MKKPTIPEVAFAACLSPAVRTRTAKAAPTARSGPEGMSRRITVIIAAIATIAGMSLAIPGAANASTTSCKVGYYDSTLTDNFPAVARLRAHNLPRLTDGYAPRCLVAESIAGSVQSYWSEHYRAPRQVKVMGARWNGGTWSVRYRVATDGEMSWGEFTARKVSKSHQVVTWRGYS